LCYAATNILHDVPKHKPVCCLLLLLLLQDYGLGAGFFSLGARLFAAAADSSSSSS
jgi:hypothetical protein